MRLGVPIALLTGCASAFLAVEARAEPYFAQREGYRCSKCHVNGTGGGMRTAFGRQWAWTHLTMVEGERISRRDRPDDARVSPPDSREFEGDPLDTLSARQRFWWTIDPQLNDHIAVCANFRLNNTTAFGEDEIQNTFANPEANFYLALNALDFLTGYVDTSVAEGSVEAREAFLMLHNLGGFRLKAGVILLPFGLRIWGEEQFIRRETGFNYANPDLGVELGYEWKGFGAFLAVTNGAGGGLDFNEQKKFSGYVEYAAKWWRLGISGSYNETEDLENLLAGGFAGLTLGRLALLAEANIIRNTFVEEGATIDSLVAYAEANFLALKGLNLKVAYGYHDPALDVAEDQRFNVRGGIEAFIIPMLASTLFYDLRESVPQDEIGNADLLIAELHLYL
jgi:hypothetical protein